MATLKSLAIFSRFCFWHFTSYSSKVLRTTTTEPLRTNIAAISSILANVDPQGLITFWSILASFSSKILKTLACKFLIVFVHITVAVEATSFRGTMGFRIRRSLHFVCGIKAINVHQIIEDTNISIGHVINIKVYSQNRIARDEIKCIIIGTDLANEMFLHRTEVFGVGYILDGSHPFAKIKLSEIYNDMIALRWGLNNPSTRNWH